jgi:hypothetical protein
MPPKSRSENCKNSVVCLCTGPQQSPTINEICSSLPSLRGTDPVWCNTGPTTCHLAVGMAIDGLREPLDPRSGAPLDWADVPGHRRWFAYLSGKLVRCTIGLVRYARLSRSHFVPLWNLGPVDRCNTRLVQCAPGSWTSSLSWILFSKLISLI